MTDKEWLEEIKNNYSVGIHILSGKPSVAIPKENFEWLIEQAEKREYWMKQHRKRANELEDAYFKIQLIEKQLQQSQAKAERYKHALKFYACGNHYSDKLYDDKIILLDDGEIARKALEESK